MPNLLFPAYPALLHAVKKPMARLFFGYVFLALLSPFPAPAQDLNLRFEHITSEDGLPQNTIHGIVKDKYGFMWFGTWAGLCRYDGYKFTTYRSDPNNPHSISNNRIHNLYKDAEHNIWIKTFDTTTVCRYNYETDDFVRVPMAKVPAAVIASNDRPRHYTRTYFIAGQYKWSMDTWTKSLVQTHLPTKKQLTYKANQANRWALNDEYVADIYLDNHNILWVGTYSYGINKANISAKPFMLYQHEPDNSNSILDNNTRAICEDREGNLWIGTRDKGITVMNRSRNTFVHYTHADKQPNSLVNDQVRKIYQDRYGFIWIGTKKGLDRFDPASGIFHHYGKALPSTAVYWIMEDRGKDLWIGTWRGMCKYDRANDCFINYDKYSTIQNRNIRVMLEDRYHNLWVGSEGGGIQVFGRKQYGSLDEALTPYAGYIKPAALGDNRIYTLYEDKQGLIWIGTGNGLHRFDPKTKQVRQFSVAEGLADAMITGVLEDDAGHLWISHKNGLSRMDKRNFAIQNFSMNDGLQSNEFAEDTFFKSRRSREIFFGGNNGFNSFFADSIQEEKYYPPIAFTDLQVLNQHVKIGEKLNGEVILPRSLNLTKEISLSYKDKSIAIEFAALHYANPKANKYAYMLEGFDKDWVSTDASLRVASYSNLEPGRYVFKVKASNSDGIWNPVPASLGIVVYPPLWATAWAYMLYVAIALGMLYVFYRYSANMAQLKSKLVYESLVREKEHELHQDKLQFFTHISHEIKTPLTLILAPIERLLQLDEGNNRVQNQLMIMRRNGDRLLKLLNQLLDFRKFETGHAALHAEPGDVVSFMQEIAISFEQLAAQSGISFEFRSAQEHIVLPFDRDKLEKIIFNLLSNAFKFTAAGGKVTLEAEASPAEGTEGMLFIRVTDTGKGIPAHLLAGIFEPFNHYDENGAEGTGLGLSYSKILAELHGGHLTAQSYTSPGASQNLTQFTLALPLCAQQPVPGTHQVPLLQMPGNAAHEEATAAVKIDARTPQLLLIEDNNELRSYIAGYLEEHYLVMQAADGREGIAMAFSNPPDLVISDVMMPGTTGIEVCRILKSDMRSSHIPVILLTALSATSFKVEGFDTGADDYITKPFSLKLLDTRIRNILVSRTRLRERFKTEFSLQPSNVAITSPDEKFLDRALRFIEERLADPGLSIEEICKETGLSRTHLYRKTKALTGLSMAEVIRNIRLKRAVQILEQDKLNISEVAYQVGFLDIDHFRKCFKAQYGFTPSEYQKSVSAGGLKQQG